MVGDLVPVQSVMRARLSTRPSFLKGVIPSPVKPNRNGQHNESFRAVVVAVIQLFR